MPCFKEWTVKNTHADEDMLKSCYNSSVLAVLLKNRGIDTPEKIEKFLNPLKSKLISPYAFLDMHKAIDRVKRAVQNKEHITIYGDFDADGITASAVLYLTLKEIGADADYYLPDRAAESHGMNTKALVRIISKRKSKLIITVDCGISNVSEVKFAESLGADVIITDHHEAPDVLPEAYAVLNPKAAGSLDASLNIEDIQSLNYLAGAGVSLKFAYGILEAFNRTDFADVLIPVAAAGTVGDVVELLGENRTITAAGIELLRSGAHKGIQKLLKTAGISDTKTVTSETIAFTVVPRLNAAGRLDTAETAIKILISEDDAVIDEAASKLNSLNEMRQKLCDETYKTAEEMYAADRMRRRKGIVLYNPDWHIGIIGIAASRLVEIYNKPVFLMTSDEAAPNIIRCSCRSIQGLNVHAVLSENKEYFEGFGGHKMAAGFSFDKKKISFEKFKALLLDTIDNYSDGIDFNKVIVQADMELEPEDITLETADLIDKMQPFGSANPSPLFIMKDAVLNSFRMMGQNANHLKMCVSKDGGKNLDCIKWNMPDFNLPLNTKLDILFSMRKNTFNDVTNVQLMAADIHSELLKQAEKKAEITVLDHRKKKNIIDRVIDFILSSKRTSAVFAESPELLKKLNLPAAMQGKVFNRDNFPDDIEQLMFFEAPVSKDDFYGIIKNSNAGIIHLMDFGVKELSADVFVSKLSGMLKYALSNLSGAVSVKRAAKALGASNDAVDCALNLLEDAGMIDLERINEDICKISYVHPIEFSKVKANSLFEDLENHLNDINAFRSFYLNSGAEEIKEMI